MATNTTATVQQIFAASVLKTMGELKEMGLKTFAERRTQEGGESIDFMRYKGGQAKDGVPTMYGSNPSDGGTFKKFTAPIKIISSQDKPTWEQMNKTKIEIKNTIFTSLTQAVVKKEDAIILDTIVKGDAQLNKIGSASLDPSSLDFARTLLAEVRDCLVSAEMTPDGKKGVALVMNRLDYKRMSTSDAFINGDFKNSITGGNNNLPLSFGGAEIFITEDDSTLVPTGTAFIIPSNSFGFAEWEGSVKSTAKFVDDDGMCWHLQVVKSIGVVLIEPNYITKVTMKPNESKRPAAAMLMAKTKTEEEPEAGL